LIAGSFDDAAEVWQESGDDAPKESAYTEIDPI
jgi:hypothetical protein